MNNNGDKKKKAKSHIAAGAKALEETLRLNEAAGSLARKAIPANDGNQIMQLHPMPMAIVDSHYVLMDANPAYEDLMQQTLEKLKKMDSSDYKIKFVSGEKTDLTFSEKRRTKCELELTFKDGRRKVVEQYGVPLTDSTGAVTQAFFVYNDITKQRDEEAELQKQMGKIGNLQKRSETIVQQNPMPILLLSTDFKILVTNEAYIAMSGFTREQLLAMSARDFKVLEQKGEGLKHVIQNKKRSFGEVTVELPRGVRVLEQHGIPIINDKGDLINIMIVYNDITEKRDRDREIQRLMEESKQRAEALAKSAHDVEIAMAAVAKGDLANLMQIDAADPLQKVKSDFNASIKSIRGLLEEVQKAVKQVENTTLDVSRSTKEIGKATEQVATSTQHSSDYARKQLEQIEAVGREVSDLSASIEEIASTSHEVMERAQGAAKEGAQAATLGNQANTKMQAVERIAKQSVDEITKLNDQMREISTIVKLITDIANQTNLLALNAAIEAARAGEHGRGFAVVAGEVRNLAGESKKATQHIEEVIGGVTTSSARTAESMKSAYSEIAAGMESVTKTIEALNNILDGMGVVAQGVTEISKATEDQANATNRVMERMEQATQLTKENMKQIEDVAALSEEVSASTEEVNAGSEELSAMAGHLKQTVDRFKLA